MYDTLVKEISEYCASAKKDIMVMQGLSKIAPTSTDIPSSTSKDLDNLKNRVITALLDNRNNRGAHNALDIVNDYMKNKNNNPRVAGVFEGVQTALCKEANQKNNVMQQLGNLQSVVGKFSADVNRSIGTSSDGLLNNKEIKAIKEVVQTANEKLQAHQDNKFANSSTVSQAKRELKSDLKSFETSLAFKSIAARVGALATSIKNSIETTINKIRGVAIPPVMRNAMSNKDNKVGFLKTDVKEAKSGLNTLDSTSEKPSSGLRK